MAKSGISFLSPKRRVLLVGDEGVVLFSMVGKGARKKCALAWSLPNFTEQLVEHLSDGRSNQSVLVLFDGVEQHYRKEQLPKVSSMDKGKVLKRKLDMAFPHATMRASLELKSEKKKTSKEPSTYLLAAVPSSENLDKVNDALFQAGVPVAGFSLLPVESSAMVSKLSERVRPKDAKKSKWAVLIGQNETGGLRQIVARGDQLALTRLTPVAEGRAQGVAWVEEVVKEFKATLTYIARFGYSAEDGLDVIVICNEEEKILVNQAALPVANLVALSVPEAANLLEVEAAQIGEEHYADVLHALWNGKKFSPTMGIKLPALQKMSMARLGAKMAVVLFVITAIGVGILGLMTIQDYLELEEQISQKEQQKNVLMREYEDESVIFETLPIKPDVIRGSIAVKELLNKNTVTPSPFLSVIKNILGADIPMYNLSFSHDPDPSLELEALAAGARRGVRRPPPASYGKPKEENGKITLTFQFTLPDTMDLESKIIKSEQIEADIKNSFPEHTINKSKEFGDVEREGAVSSQDKGHGKLDFAEISIEGAPL